MGALWGALGGAADAAKEVYGRKQEAEIAEAKAGADEKRAMRLEKMRQKYRSTEAEAQREFRTDEREASQTFQSGEASAQREEAGKQKEYDRQQRAVEGFQDRESAERIADKKVAASTAGKGSTKENERYKFTTKKLPEKFTPDGGMTGGGEVMTVTDKKTQQTFTQQGDIFVPQGDGVEMRQPGDRKGALAKLRKNPELAQQFLSTYKWLPVGYLEHL